MTKEHCSNCGQILTEENIRFALEDASGLMQEELTFCCPTYTDEKGCLGYSKEDENKPAYWSTK